MCDLFTVSCIAFFSVLLTFAIKIKLRHELNEMNIIFFTVGTCKLRIQSVFILNVLFLHLPPFLLKIQPISFQTVGNEALVLQIQGRDLIASEAHYHASCYRAATRMFSKTREEEIPGNKASYQRIYELFCRDITENRVIKKKEIFRMTTLTEMFVTFVSKDG